MVFLDADVHLGHPDFVELRKQIFQQKGPVIVNIVSSNPMLEIAFDQRGMPLCGAAPIKFYSYEKSLQQAHEFFSCCFDDALLDGP